LTEVRKYVGVHFDSALELVIRALAPWPNIWKTVGLKNRSLKPIAVTKITPRLFITAKQAK